MKSADCIKRGQYGTLLPRRDIRSVLASQYNSTVDLTQVLVVPLTRLVAPCAETTVGERHTAPVDCNARLEFSRILRVNLRALLQRYLNPLLRRQRAEFVSIRPPHVRAKKHTFAGASITARRITNRRYRQIGVGNATVNVFVLLPEAALELKAHLDRRFIGHRIYCVLHGLADGDIDFAQY